jgi:uncharacterized membrane protein
MTEINLAHIHLLLNHFPTIGFVVGLGLLAAALVAKSEDLKRASYLVLFLIAVIAIPAYLSGNAAEARLCPEGECPPEVAVSVVRTHEDGALLAFSFMELTAFLAWLGMWQTPRTRHLPSWNVAAVLLLAVVTFILMGLAADAGSEIRHPEIAASVAAESQTDGDTAVAPGEPQADQAQDPQSTQQPEPTDAQAAPQAAPETEATATPGPAEPISAEEYLAQMAAETPKKEPATGVARRLGAVVSGATGNSWLWPASETIHFVGLCLLFTVVLIVNLRVLGMIKQVPFSAVYQLLPLGMLGFVLNLITGMLFFIGQPGQYTNNVVFYWKIVFIVLAALNALYFTWFDEIWRVGPGKDAPIRAKVVSATAIFLWAGVLYCGHMLPFLGTSF